MLNSRLPNLAALNVWQPCFGSLETSVIVRICLTRTFVQVYRRRWSNQPDEGGCVMTRTWDARMLALGTLALALGCRSTPNVPPCHTPLMPEEVVAKPPLTPTAPSAAPGTIQPPTQFTKLPDGKQPDNRLPEMSPDGPTIHAPSDVAPLLSNQQGPP